MREGLPLESGYRRNIVPPRYTYAHNIVVSRLEARRFPFFAIFKLRNVKG